MILLRKVRDIEEGELDKKICIPTETYCNHLKDGEVCGMLLAFAPGIKEGPMCRACGIVYGIGEIFETSPFSQAPSFKEDDK